MYISSLKEKLPTPLTTTFTIPLASHSIGVVEPGELTLETDWGTHTRDVKLSPYMGLHELDVVPSLG